MMVITIKLIYSQGVSRIFLKRCRLHAGASVVLLNGELFEMMMVAHIPQLLRSTWEWIAMMLVAGSSIVKSRAALQLENLALRHQIGVLQRSAKKRLSLNNADRLFWIGLSRVWAGVALGVADCETRHCYWLFNNLGVPRFTNV